MRRLLSFLFLVLGSTAAAVSFGAPAASAHNTFLDSSPAAGESLSASPTTWTVRFTKSVPLVSASGSVVDGDGTRATLGPPRHGEADNVVVFDLPGGLTGAVTARWRLVSSDGHVISGRVAFTVGEVPSTVPGQSVQTGQSSAGSGTAPSTVATSGETGVPRAVRVVLRAANYLAIVLLGGLIFVDLDVAGGAMASQRGRRLLMWGGGGVAVVPFAQFIVLAIDVRTDGEGMGAAIVDAASLTPGAMLLLRGAVGGIVALAGRTALAVGTDSRSIGRLFAASGAVYLVALAYVGHSRSQSWPLVGVPVDAVHTAAVAVWLGGLVVMLLVVVPAVAPAVAVTAFRRFGAAAFWAVVVIVATGMVQTVRLHSGVSTLVTSPHGLLLLAKIALVGGMVRLAARNRRVLAARPVDQADDVRPVHDLLVRTTLSEVGMGFMVVLVTAVLVAVTPG